MDTDEWVCVRCLEVSVCVCLIYVWVYKSYEDIMNVLHMGYVYMCASVCVYVFENMLLSHP